MNPNRFFGILKSLSLITASVVFLSGCAGNGVRQAEVDRITPEELAALVPTPIATVTLDEIVADSKAGKTSDEIIAKIRASDSRYELTSTQILDLSKQGVDIKVLDYIQQSNELAKQNAIAEEMNRRNQEKQAQLKRLQQERDQARLRYYDPFWGYGYPGWIGPIGPAGRYWRGGRYGWGIGFGYPYGWGW